MAKLEILTLDPSVKSDLKRFINLPWKIYNKSEHPQWVAPLKIAVKESLDVAHNPFYKRAKIKLLIATRDGRDVGRIAAIVNDAHNEYHEENTGFYGYFECINDQEVADHLFAAAEKQIKDWGLSMMRGPVNPSTNHECGLLVRGQSQHPTIMTTWNPKYYQDLHENAGMKNAKDLVAYILATSDAHKLPERLLEHSEKLRKDGRITFRDFDVKNFERDAEICFDIYNAAWEKNWGFVPMNKEEFMYSAKDLKMVMDRRFAFIAEVDGKPAGFMISLPDVNLVLKYNRGGRLIPGVLKLLVGRPFIKMLRIVTLGVKPEFRRGGIFQAFTHEAWMRGKKYGIKYGEASWILEDNEGMNKPWQEIGAPIYRRWRIYERPVERPVERTTS